MDDDGHAHVGFEEKAAIAAAETKTIHAVSQDIDEVPSEEEDIATSAAVAHQVGGTNATASSNNAKSVFDRP